ncbi:MAG: hypothetical protein ACTSYC_09365 [Promethearchaeota archaeon]
MCTFFYSQKLIISGTWTLIGATIVLIISRYFVKPGFSEQCVHHDWNVLLEDYVLIGNIKLPWMVILGILSETFGNGWTRIAIFI